MYATGQGVPLDDVQAYQWFSISLALGNAISAKNRERVAGRMTPAQIAQAENLAREWRPKAAMPSITIRPRKDGAP
jgi:TPR repeat protein